MSGNRANSAAIQRRTNVGAPVQQQQQQQQGRHPVQTPQRGNGSQQPQRFVNQQQQQQQQQPKNNSRGVQEPIQMPKLSVSDAMALVTLRLGRVETFINSMPTLEELHNTSSSSNVDNDNIENENTRVVDEIVFTNIVSRLDTLEKEKTNQVPIPPQPSNTKELLDMNNNFKDLSKKYETFKEELFQLKNLLLSVQSFTMQTNTKLDDFITETENNKKKTPPPPSLLVQESSSVEEDIVVENNDVLPTMSLEEKEEDKSDLPETSV